jgi:ppGpp synthetase/RelA/SpoT-type nucleotidyltranferase
MRLPHLTLIFVLIACMSCNPFVRNGQDPNAKDHRNAPMEDVELQRLKPKDSLKKKLQKKREPQALDTLKPKSA